MYHVRGMRHTHTEFWSGNLKGKYNWEETVVGV